MNLTYDYYVINQSKEVYPSWIKFEHYSYSDRFPSIFSIFKRKL